MQEAEKLGLSTSEDVKVQMELARQTIMIRELFADYQKKNPVTEAEMKAEYDKFAEAVKNLGLYISLVEVPEVNGAV